VINVDAPFGQQLLHIAVGQALTQIPTHRRRNELTRESIPAGADDMDGLEVITRPVSKQHRNDQRNSAS